MIDERRCGCCSSDDGGEGEHWQDGVERPACGIWEMHGRVSRSRGREMMNRLTLLASRMDALMDWMWLGASDHEARLIHPDEECSTSAK